MDFDTFTLKYNNFMDRCHAYNNSEAWDEDEYCEMGLFYESSLSNLLLSLVATDEVINEKEVDFLNQFGVGEFSLERLQDIYSCCRENIDNYYDVHIIRDIDLLKRVGQDFADEYKDLVKGACELIISSDGVVADAEKQQAARLINRL